MTVAGKSRLRTPTTVSCTALLNDRVVPVAAVEDVLPRAADQDVVAGTAREIVVAGAADQDVVPVSAVGRELNRPDDEAAGVHGVIAILGLDDQSVVGGLGARDVDLRGQAEDACPGRVSGHHDHVVVVRAIDDDVVGRAVAGSAARSRFEIEVDLGHVRAAQVVHGNLVDAAAGREVDALDVIQIHDNAGDVAGKSDARAVGRDIDLLGDGGAVELHGVEAGLSLDDVVVVARVPDEGVVAGTHLGHVVTVPTIDEVVALAASQRIVAQTAVDDQIDRAGRQAGGVDGVDPCLAIHSQLVLSRDAAGDVDDGLQAVYADAGRAAVDGDLIVRLRATDDDAVGLAVGHAASGRPREVEVDPL